MRSKRWSVPFVCAFSAALQVAPLGSLRALPFATIRVPRSCVMQQGWGGFSSFVDSLMKVTEDAVKTINDVSDDWMNSGWQVKKRAGQVLPDIRPSAFNGRAEQIFDPNVPNNAEAPPRDDGLGSDLGGELGSEQLGMAGAAGALAAVDAKADAILATKGGAELQVCRVATHTTATNHTPLPLPHCPSSHPRHPTSRPPRWTPGRICKLPWHGN